METLTIERDVQDIMNQATELSEAASANASLTRSIAQASVSVCMLSVWGEGGMGGGGGGGGELDVHIP